MNTTKKFALSLILFIIATAFCASELIKQKGLVVEGSNKTDLILYYGSTCPHCRIVEEHIRKNGLAAKLNITQKEISQNQDNQNEFIEKARICGLDLNNLGVPMLFDAKNSKCHEGDQPIIDFLKQQTK